MGYPNYVFRHLRGSWLRSLLTLLAMALCIFLFCVIQTFIGAIQAGLRSASDERLIVRNAVSLVFPLPQYYADRIAAIVGVRRVAAAVWYGGYYQDPKNFFPNFAIQPPDYLAIYPEYVLAPDHKAAFLADRRGCIVGRETAERFGWQVGDRFQLRSTIPTYQGPGPLEFVIRGIYDTDRDRFPATNLTQMFFHYDYLYEATGRTIAPGIFVARISDADRASEIARRIDALFENTDAQTRTETEAAFRAGFVALAGNLALLLHGIGLAVTFTILIVSANTMTMAVRERRREIAVLKTLGFSSRRVMALVLGESAAIGIGGGALGAAAATVLIGAARNMPGVGGFVRGLPDFGMSPARAATALTLAVAIALAAGLVPALTAFRTRISEALRQP